ncbi:hypothetical protein [Acidiphilium sp.]|uniref:hypothetical protein n=1 Tax=Acidiphilium sp. TaxID=527 RepID=UPI003D018411
MKRIFRLIPALMFSLPAYGQSLTLPKGDIPQAGLSVTVLKTVGFTPMRRAYGAVVSPKKLIEAVGHLRLFEADWHLAASTLARTRYLSAAPYHVSEAELQKAEAVAERAKARVEMTKASLLADYGPVLARAIIRNSQLIKSLDSAKTALVEVSIPMPFVAEPPLIARARRATVSTVRTGFIKLRRIGLAGVAPVGLIGQNIYYTSPYLQAGSTLMVQLAVGPTQRGVVVPASAVIFFEGHAFVFEQTSNASFELKRIPTTEPDRLHSRLIGYFVPTDRAPTKAIVIHGAGFLFAIIAHQRS